MGSLHPQFRRVPSPIAEAIEAGIVPTKAYRIYSDTSIADLAARARLEPRRLCLIEAGSAPTRSEAEAIRHALGLSNDASPWAV